MGWKGTAGRGVTGETGVVGSGVGVTTGAGVGVGRKVGEGVTVGAGWAVLEAVGAAVSVAALPVGDSVRAGVSVAAGLEVRLGGGGEAVNKGVGVAWSEQAASSPSTKGRRQIKERICLDILLDSFIYKTYKKLQKRLQNKPHLQEALCKNCFSGALKETATGPV